MKIVYNNIIPFKGYLAMCIYPFLFVRKDAPKINKVDINHEKIHGYQQGETTFLFLVLAILGIVTSVFPWWCIFIPFVCFYAFYGLEYVIRLFAYGFNMKEAYRNISYEQEAYANEKNLAYLSNERKVFANFKFLFKKTYKSC